MMLESETATAGTAVILTPDDPARRPDVLFRVRRAPGSQMSAWWMIGAFVLTSAAVVAVGSLLPAGL